jgi:integrase
MLCLQEEKPTIVIRNFSRRKAPKLSVFIPMCMEKGIVRPVDIKREFEALYPKQKPKTLEAYLWQCKKLGLTKEIRDQKGVDVARKESQKHVLDYPEVQTYILAAGQGRIQNRTIEGQKKGLIKIWEIMGRTDPHNWTYNDILINIEKVYPKAEDNRGRMTFSKPGAVNRLLSAINTIFPSPIRVPKGFGTGLAREAGELKDFFTFDEFNLFIENLTDTCSLSKEGWEALYKAQVNMGCREGNLGKIGIVSLLWEDIDYSRKRCSLREKGGRGNAGRIWMNLPLDLFPWLNGWNALMIYHKQRFGYVPTNERHETGNVFAVSYDEYRHQFYTTRKRCNGRISGDKETMRPHILRKTHAQWLVKLWVPIEQICGLFPDGHFGVGWDNPKILLKYYVTLEDEQRFKAEQQANERMKVLGLTAEAEVS